MKTSKQGDHPRSDSDPTVSLQAYKARPLNGIWASSPYLHNGSVPTLHDLLLPAAQRPRASPSVAGSSTRRRSAT
ncbi:hypothetical protein [Nannocystis pusilla]|uniref:c-type cytochrome n=1 Tax=Nannocystis pusilla TaxID=889268 RepID=UPI003B7A74E8